MNEDILKPIRDLTAELEIFDNMDEAIAILSKFQKTVKVVTFDYRSGVYRYFNYYIVLGFKAVDTTFISNLRLINKLGQCRTSAPVLVHYGLSQDNRFAAIIYKVNDTKGGKIVPLRFLTDISPVKRAQFLAEQIKLLEDTGLYNSAVVDSYDNWCVTPDTHNIHIASWGNLIKCETPEEKERIREQLLEVVTPAHGTW